MHILLHPVLRYWVAGAFVLFLATALALHTVHTTLAACVAGFGLGLIMGVSRQLRVPAQEMETSAPPAEFVASLPSLVSALELPAIALDTSQSVLAFNAGATDLFPGIDVGTPLSRFNRHPDLMQALTHVANDGLSRSLEIVDHRPNGRRLRVTVARLGAAAASNPDAALLTQFRDLTEQDRLAQMRSDFIANASHELRTPLASLKGFIETLQGPASADAAARTKFLDIMATQAARMMRILDDLLSLSRIEMRAHLPPTGEVDLNDILQEVVQGLEPLARLSRISLQRTATDGPFLVRGEKDELIQVFQNLVHNAVKYGNEGGRVDIEVQRLPPSGSGTRARVRVDIRDDGPGIAAEHLPRLTERFYRVDTAASRARGGTGLGLAIVKHILNRHRGELRIASEVGKGSTFSVSLDLVR